MMFFHRRCGSSLLLDISQAFVIRATIGVSFTKLTSGSCSVDFREVDGIPAIFVCSTCGNRIIPESEVLIKCQYCGQDLTTREAFIIKGSGGVYCEGHARRMLEEVPTSNKRIISVAEILANPIKIGH